MAIQSHKCKTTHTKGFKKTIECVWDFDFDGVSNTEIMALAMRSVVISAQRDARDTKTTDAFMVYQKFTFNVRKMIDNIKRGRTPAEKAAAYMESMSPEALEQALRDAIARKQQK